MSAAARKLELNAVHSNKSTSINFRIATVLQTSEGKSVRISHPELLACWAHIAIDSPHSLPPGSRVLVVADQQEYFIVAVLEPTTSSIAPKHLKSCSGASAMLEVDEKEQEVLRICDSDGHLLFEHFPQKQQSIIYSADGDLNFSSNGKISMQAKEGVQICSPEGVCISATDSEGKEQSSFSIKRYRSHLKSAIFELQAAKGAFSIGEVKSVISKAVLHVEQMKSVYRTLEVNAQKMLEKTREVYREAEELAQTRAGRLRMVAGKTFHLLAQHAHVKAKKALKLKGEKIYLS